MGYYSIVAFSPHAVGIPKPLVLLDRGPNVFTVQTDDLEEFLEKLYAEGVEVKEVHDLEGVTDANQPSIGELLAGEHEAGPEG